MSLISDALPEAIGGAAIVIIVMGWEYWRGSRKEAERRKRLRNAVYWELSTLNDLFIASKAADFVPQPVSSLGVRILVAGQSDVVDLATFSPMLKDLELKIASYNGVVHQILGFSTGVGIAIGGSTNKVAALKLILQDHSDAGMEICDKAMELVLDSK